MKLPWAKKSEGTGQTVTTGVQTHIEEQSDYFSVVLGSGVLYQANCYGLCPPLQEVIGKRAQGVLNGRLLPTDKEGNVIKSAAFDAQMKILNRPNVHQSFTEFLSCVSHYIDIFGVCYLYKGESIGFGLTSIIIIPNTSITPMYKGIADVLGNQPIIDQYVVNLFGKSWTLKASEGKIVEVRDRTINPILPMRVYSRIDGLKYPIQNIVASLESRNQIIVKRGADVVFSPEASNDKGVTATMLNTAQTDEIQSTYARYGSIKARWHAAIFKVPVKVQQVTRNPKDLGLMDGEDQDVRSILRAYNTPPIVFGMKDEAKYNTYLEGKAEFYEDGVIPHSRIIAEGLDTVFDAAKKGYKNLFDFSHLQCMQRSEKEKTEALGKMVDALNTAVTSGLMDIKDAKAKLEDYLR